jgi:hypothetical protein
MFRPPTPIPWLATFAALAACTSSPSATHSSPEASVPAAGGDATAGDGGRAPEDGSVSRPDGADSGYAPETASPDTAPLLHDAAELQYDQVAPPPAPVWASVTSNLTGKASECGNVSAVFSNPYQDMLIVGIALDGLWSSTDGAASWTAIGTSGDAIKNRMSSIVWDPAHPQTFWESGIYGWETSTDGAFLTLDNGGSFQGYSGLASLNQTNDSIAIDFSDPQRKTLLAGSHEQKQTLFLSTDSGTTWTNIGPSLPAGLGFCTQTLIVDSSTLLVGCAASWSGEAGAILRSTTAGASWTSVMASGVSGQPLVAADAKIYWAAEGGGIFTSTDQGQTWAAPAASNMARSLPPLELPDGRIAATQGTNLVLSADHGSTWTTIGPPMPYTPNGFTYSPFRSAFFISYFTCTAPNAVPADGIEELGWDYRTN